MSLKKFLTSVFENEKISRFLQKYKGCYFGILCALFLSFMLIGGSIVYNLTEPLVTPQTMFTHWISNLGAAKNGAQYIFGACMLMNIGLSIPFLLDFERKLYLENPNLAKWLQIPFISSILTDISGFFLTVFNLIDFPIVHVIFATIFFNCCELLVVSLSVIVLYKRKSNKWMIQAAFGIPVIVCFSLFLVPIVPMLFGGQDLFSVITSMDSSLNSLRFWEWMSVISLIFWFLGSGLFFLFLK